jgi:histidyl-tRNA synthetase
VLGGGRYDGLVETLGGPHTPAVGWAAGIERLAMLVGGGGAERPNRPNFAVFAEVGEHDNLAVEIATRLRNAGFAVELKSSGSPKKRYSKANFDENNFLIWVTEAEGGGPLIKARNVAKYATWRPEAPLLRALLTGIAEMDARFGDEFRVHETWDEMTQRHGSQA